MLPAQLFQKMLLLLPLAYNQGENGNNNLISNNKNNSTINSRWDYENIPAWGEINPTCNNGTRQSPIALSTRSSLVSPLQPLRFHNYNIPLSGELIFFNNGHTVEMEIPVTTDGSPAYISGGMLIGRYVAQNVHFHWGARGVKGSEHSINNERFDVEMHIVHRNSRYSAQEAGQYKDGLAVLAVMLKIVDKPDRFYPGLNMLLNRLPDVIEFNSTVRVEGPLAVGQLLGDLNTKQFYTYKGSLTTPPCSEAVTWNVFPEPLPVVYEQIAKFYNIKDENGKPLLENYRPLQNRNGRPVFYRVSTALDPVLFP